MHAIVTHRWWARARRRHCSSPASCHGVDATRRRRSTCRASTSRSIVVTGEVTGTETWTNTQLLRPARRGVRPQGATLNIQAGTRIIGESGSVGTLIVERGGRLNAIGTREQPIVFTSDQPVGAASRGDWGGLIINGRAPVNLAGRRRRRRRRHRRLRRHRRRTTTAGRCATCASSSPASSSARTTS